MDSVLGVLDIKATRYYGGVLDKKILGSRGTGVTRHKEPWYRGY